MTSIELTEEHKSKILEMCNKLFPEYNKIEIDIEANYDGTQDYLQFTKINPSDTIFIHWFEFCMITLQQKLCKLLDKPVDLWNIELIGKLFFYTNSNGIHPIDYLYEEFKNLKK